MLILALDEAGDFENTAKETLKKCVSLANDAHGRTEEGVSPCASGAGKRFNQRFPKDPSGRSKFTLIGGVIYDDQDSDGDEDAERKRIEAYYRAAVHSVNGNFPEDLHYGKNRDNENVGKVKKEVSTTLPEFLKKGTYKSRDLCDKKGAALPVRKGKYYICAIVKSTKGKQALLKSEIGDFFRDGIASNIYFHMVSEAVEHFIFHNPYFPEAGKFKLDIAKRESPDIDEDAKNVYLEQGFIEKSTDKNAFTKEIDRVHFSLLNADVFRTILSEQMIADGKKSIQIHSMNMISVGYGKKETKFSGKIFLYLADSVCSQLSYVKENERSEITENDIREINNRAFRLTGEDNLIFSYDEADELLKKSLRALETEEFYDSLRYAFKIMASETKESEFYREKWIPFIEKAVTDRIMENPGSGEKTSAVYTAVQELRNAYLTNRLNPEEAFYIFTVLEKSCALLKDSYFVNALRFYINDIGLKAYSHKGDPQRAEIYYEECVKYADAVNIDDYIMMRNQYATSLCDAFDYGKAVRIMGTSIDLLQRIYDVFKAGFEDGDKLFFGKRLLAETYSLAGQCASFMGEEDSAQIYFQSALSLFDSKDDSRKRTESYYLHHLIDSENRIGYLKQMALYCGSADVKTYKNHLDAILEMAGKGTVNGNYAMYLFLKGLCFFGSTNDVRSVWEDIKAWEEAVNKTERQAHPWEIIYKYLWLLADRVNDSEKTDEFCQRITELSSGCGDNLVDVISLMSLARLYHEMKNTSEENRIFDIITDKLNDHFPLFFKELNSEKTFTDKEKKVRYIREKFRYMYD
ncbi:MAG: hypothetical protein K5770_01450 [Lachnospiraceae bacterium]|nr:hypothetical protein [Lachnospiraceae bacterium]